MITNRYFILSIPHSPNSSLWNIVIENPNNVNKNNLHTKMVVKLYVGDTNNHSILNGIPEYTHQQILVKLGEPEWTPPFNL